MFWSLLISRRPLDRAKGSIDVRQGLPGSVMWVHFRGFRNTEKPMNTALYTHTCTNVLLLVLFMFETNRLMLLADYS